MRYIPIIILFMLLNSLNMSGQTINLTEFSNIVLPNHNIGFNYLTRARTSAFPSSMTYEMADIDDRNAAFTFNCNIPALPDDDFKGYPSSTIGGFKTGGANGTYSPGVRSACGMPVQIKDLNNDLRIKWRVSQQNATDPDDKWWASINVIFDNRAETLEPVSDDRDYDLVIELNRYANETRIDDQPISNNDYWKFARIDKNNSSSPLKTFDLRYGGQVYKWAVRYKFFNYPATDPRSTKNNKVHVKFISMYASNAVAPYLDHPLKAFVDASKNYLQFVNLSPEETAKVNAQVALPNTWIKSISAGYEVYTGAFTIKNEVFKTVIDNTPPAIPTNLVITKTNTANSLNWNDVVDDALEGYQIYRSVNGGGFQVIATAYVSDYIDTDVNAANSYLYYVVAMDKSFNKSRNSTPISLSMKAFLEGSFNNTTSKMNDNLRIGNIIQSQRVEPYTALNVASNFAQFDGGGGETVTPSVFTTTGDNAIVDWVFVELRNAASPATVLYTRSALVQVDGDIVDIDGVSPVLFGSAPSGNYIVTIKHRNHLRVKTNASINLRNGINLLNFTNNTIVGGTSPIKSVTVGGNTVYMLHAGDLNQDGTINATDRSEAWNNRNTPGYNQNDCSMNGTVDATDRSIIWNNRNISAGF
jgi:hypothetical protein